VAVVVCAETHDTVAFCARGRGDDDDGCGQGMSDAAEGYKKKNNRRYDGPAVG
jgi:hypothetical protein